MVASIVASEAHGSTTINASKLATYNMSQFLQANFTRKLHLHPATTQQKQPQQSTFHQILSSGTACTGMAIGRSQKGGGGGGGCALRGAAL